MDISDSCGYQTHNIFGAKTTFMCHDWQRQHFMLLILRTREGLMSTITKLRLSLAEETLFKHACARLPPIEVDRNPAIIHLAY